MGGDIKESSKREEMIQHIAHIYCWSYIVCRMRRPNKSSFTNQLLVNYVAIIMYRTNLCWRKSHWLDSIMCIYIIYIQWNSHNFSLNMWSYPGDKMEGNNTPDDSELSTDINTLHYSTWLKYSLKFHWKWSHYSNNKVIEF